MIRFAVFTDLHYDYIPDGEQRLNEFIDSIQGENLDFIISLGDLCHPIDEYKVILTKLRKLNIPLYFLMGNHDSDMFPQEQWKKFVGVKESYQSFVIDNTKFIMLNSCYMKHQNEFRCFYKRNYTKKTDLYPIIPNFEINWLKNEMMREDLNYVIFSHHSLVNEFADRGIKNRSEIQEILSSRRTILCMNGHDHGQGCKIIRNIPYYTLNSMSYIWHGLKKIYSYPQDIHDKYPGLEDIILYKNELHCIVQIKEHSISIKGMQGAYKDIRPEDVGITNRSWNGVSIEPGVLDFKNEIEI